MPFAPDEGPTALETRQHLETQRNDTSVESHLADLYECPCDAGEVIRSVIDYVQGRLGVGASAE